MPRAFLITHRRYNGAEEEFEESGRDYSPDRGVRLVEFGGNHPTSDGASECGSDTSSECPEELYNLTKLAEVSLAAAAGTLVHTSNVIYERPISPRCAQSTDKCARAAPSRAKPHQPQQQQPHPLQGREAPRDEDKTRGERARRFFERIESEREILESRSTGTVLELRLSSAHHHRYSHRQEESDQRRTTAQSTLDNDTPTESVPKTVTTACSPAAQGRASAPATAESAKSEDNEDHECPDCGKKYSTSSNLARHRQTHRSLGDKKARRCPHCDKVYVSMPAFSMHVRTHNQGCKCHYCGKCFSRPWLLQGHIRTHTGEKPFKCTICNKAFADKSNLRAHIQTHSNTKPHVCGRCGKAFALKSYLYKHEESSCMRAHHRSSTEKNEQNEQKSKTTSATASTTSTTSTTPTPTPPTKTNAPLTAPCVTASPTSVIVPRFDFNRDQRNSASAFSAIIRHTRTSEPETTATPSAKRLCKEKVTYDERHEGQTTNRAPETPDYVSRMVIRTSVISPNPEHLGRFAGKAKKPSPTYDFSDSRRASAFARPAAMTLNLAIA